MMNMKSYAVIVAVSYLMFGICLLLIPNEFLSLFGCPLDKNGEMVARTFAASLLGGFALHLSLRNSSIPSDIAKSIYSREYCF
jgi:hypothetical protein